MPTVNVDKEHLFTALGKNYTTEEFDELCFQFGIELDDDTTEDVTKAGLGERPTLKIDIPANRYDLLCHEGISRALLVFLGKVPQPQIRLAPPAQMLEMRVSKDTARIRPFVAAAVLRGVKFTPENYANFIDLQDKLHQNLARRRTLVAIGTHDLGTVEGPFTYEALPPKEIRFTPLNKTEEYDASQLMELYESDRHLSRYLHIIKDSPVYPIIYDAKRRVCSMPPIINGNLSKITLNTTDVFIECTATDETKLSIVLNIMVAMFGQYTKEPFVVEPVKIMYPSGEERITPDLSPRRTTARVAYVNRCTGLGLSAAQICHLLQKMGHSASPSPSAPEAEVTVDVPATRPDILHECDLMEDVAVAYGFDNLPKTFPSTNTVAAPLPINKVGDLMRRECACSGWVEVLPLILCSHDENFASLNRKDDGTTAIVLENPKTSEYQVVRTSLLPGILKTIRENRKHALPLRTFEVSDVAFKDPTETERCARNERRVAAVYCDKAAAFEVVHGLLDKLMLALGYPRIDRADKSKRKGYYIAEAENPTFFPGRAATIHLRPAASGAPEKMLSDDGPSGQPALDAAATSKESESASLPAPGSQSEPASGLASASSPLNSVKDTLGKALSDVLSSTRGAAHKSRTLAGQSCDVEIGALGVLHPQVLKAFDIDFPCSALEFDLEPFL